ncbi:MAG: hypothetical protein ACPGGE_06345, partial [Poseidonia sp.]
MERGPTCQAVFNRRDRSIRFTQACDNACPEFKRGNDTGAPIDFNNLACTRMTQTDGVKVDIFPTQRRHGVNR